MSPAWTGSDEPHTEDGDLMERQRVLGVGLLGCGAFGGYVLDAVADLPGVRIAACGDPGPGRAAALAGAHGAVAVTGGLPDLLAAGGVDVVVIATPPATHERLALAALAAGRHVFCEKPLATTAAGAARVRDAAAAHGRVLVVDHVLRYNPLLRALLRLRAEGLLDDVRRFAFENDAADEALEPGHWFWDPARSGGIHIEHGVHFFDAARELTGGVPLTVTGTEVRRGPDGPVDIVVATAVHPGGAVATHTHSFTHAHRAERQLMRLDYGFAEARLTGWIPAHAVLDVWTDDAGARRWAELPSRSAELLHVPGHRPNARAAVTVEVARDAGPVAPARGRGVSRSVPHRVTAVLTLGGEEAKPQVYAGSVRAAFADLTGCVATGRRPVADAQSGVTAVAVAEAATRSAALGAVVPVEVP